MEVAKSRDGPESLQGSLLQISQAAESGFRRVRLGFVHVVSHHLAVVLVVPAWLRILIQGWSWDARHEPPWIRRLGERWKRAFPSREEREAMRRGFEVRPGPEPDRQTQRDDSSDPPPPRA